MKQAPNTLLPIFLLAGVLQAPALAAGETAPTSTADFEKDRASILAMAGEFKVDFDFRETASFQQGYQLKNPYLEEAHELVLLARDDGRRIELQHILVAEGKPIKHWRQIWIYEDTRLCEFQGGATWKMRNLGPDQAKGTWTQQVTQIDDSPRYESVGKWEHRNGVSQWTSGLTWRPLPRRELKRKDEYQVLAGTNRHTITASGWIHEQDNDKTVVENGAAKKAIAREIGLNTYTRLTPGDKIDLSAAKTLWEKEQKFWAQVVAAWDAEQKDRPVLSVAKPEELRSLHEAIGKLKNEPAAGDQWPIRQKLADFLGAVQ